MENKRQTISLHITPEIDEKIKAISKDIGRASKSDAIRYAILKVKLSTENTQ